MKPTPEQVVEFFELDPEAVGSEEIRAAIDRYCDETWNRVYDKDVCAMAGIGFYSLYGMEITDYFKPNHGKDE